MSDANEAKKRVAYKTVEIFSGITGKDLVLKECTGTPYTDGREIGISFAQSTFYQDLEHEIAHILFRSDPVAKSLFVREYTDRIAKILEKQGAPLGADKLMLLRHGVDRIVAITEDHRINSLWGLLYPGSHKIIREQDKMLTKQLVHSAHDGVCQLYMALAGGWTVDKGRLSNFIPFMEEALNKVEHRGFEATLMVSKWLVANMVSELVRDIKGEPPPNKPEEKDQNQGLWTPPKVDATPEERAEALNKLIDRMGILPPDIAKKILDMKEPELKERGAVKAAADMVTKALKLDIHDDEEVARCLGDSAKDMEEVVQDALDALSDKSGGMSKDGWLRKDIGAKVVFLDVREKDIDRDSLLILPEDLDAVKRLRSVFNKVMGRRKFILDDRGTDLDVAAHIERLATSHPIPTFKQETAGRGFKALILVDRSSSMFGSKKTQSERACRIVSRALKYPFVDLHIWGWNSQERGQISIARFDPKLEVFDSPKSRVSGTTPLHLAVKVGARFMEIGTDAKHMIVTTDGQPVFTHQNGAYYSNEALYTMTKDEVKRARTLGINVTGVIIGHDIQDKPMTYMFGSRHWRRLGEDTMGTDLVKLVTSSFMDYLKRG